MSRRTTRWLLITGCWLLWGLFNASRLRLVIDHGDWNTALLYALPDALFWALLTPIPVYLSRRFEFRPGHLAAFFALHLTAGVLVAVTHSTVDAAQGVLRVLLLGGDASFAQLFVKIIRHTLHLNVMIYAAIVGITHYLDYRETVLAHDRQTAELRARLSEAQLDSLRMQLRPHFLFNALHTVSGLMENDPATGRRVIRQLGELLRMSLNPRDVHEVPLKRELDFVRAYLEIEQVRFRERLSVSIDAAPDTLRLAVPIFVLQPIVENAVRHGISDRPEGGRLEIRCRRQNGRLELVVEDDGPGLGPRAVAETQSGIGIPNTRSRLDALYGEDHEFLLETGEQAGLRVRILIPERPAGAGSGTRVA